MNGSTMPVAGLYLVTALCSTSATPVSIQSAPHALRTVVDERNRRTWRAHVDVPGAIRLHPVRVAPALSEVLDGLLREHVGVRRVWPWSDFEVRRRDAPELPAGERCKV